MMTDDSEAGRSLPAADDGMPAFKRARYQQILDVGLAALQAREYEEIKVNDLALTAGLAKATIYSYFSSKEHLYAVILRQWAEQEPRFQAPPGTGAGRVRSRAHAIVSAVERRPHFYRLNVALSSSTEPEVQAELAAIGARSRRLLSGDFAAIGVAAPQDAASMLQAIIHSALTSAVCHGAPFAGAYRLTDRFIDLYDPARSGRSDETGDAAGAFAGEKFAAAGPVVREEPMAAFKRERRDRIVAVAMAALKEQPYEQIHVSEIAQRARVALGTLYRYFPSKEYLYAVVLREWLLTSRFLLPFEDVSAEERIRARVAAAIDAFEADPRFFKTVSLLHSTRDDAVRAVLGEMASLGKAILLADFHTIGDVEPEDAASMLWSIINSLATGAIYYNGSFPETRRLVGEFVGLVAGTARTADPVARPA